MQILHGGLQKVELKAKSIKLFCAVVETGSLLSAANQNALSAPAASRSISQLEDRLHCRLFDRSTKNLTLTEDGKAFYRPARSSIQRIGYAALQAQRVDVFVIFEKRYAEQADGHDERADDRYDDHREKRSALVVP